MAISKKYRRTIICSEVKCLWWICKDEDCWDVEVLNIVSEDKKVILSYPLNIPSSYVISKGKVFQNYISNGSWGRYKYSMLHTFPITPKFVSELILWATLEKDAERYYWNENDIRI